MAGPSITYGYAALTRDAALLCAASCANVVRRAGHSPGFGLFGIFRQLEDSDESARSLGEPWRD